MAASHGSRNSMRLLALIYREGIFVDRDEDQAQEWEEMASDM